MIVQQFPEAKLSSPTPQAQSAASAGPAARAGDDMAVMPSLPVIQRARGALQRPVDGDQPSTRSTRSSHSREGGKLDKRQVVVLIAEDEETIAETLAMIVDDVGYQSVVARDGREALALARERRPQLIITDLMMPYLNGVDLIAALRRDAMLDGVSASPVIMVTAASRGRAEASGADMVITKPFDVSTIEQAMAQLLHES